MKSSTTEPGTLGASRIDTLLDPSAFSMLIVSTSVGMYPRNDLTAIKANSSVV
jgi:hypothetical protein